VAAVGGVCKGGVSTVVVDGKITTDDVVGGGELNAGDGLFGSVVRRRWSACVGKAGFFFNL